MARKSRFRAPQPDRCAPSILYTSAPAACFASRALQAASFKGPGLGVRSADTVFRRTFNVESLFDKTNKHRPHPCVPSNPLCLPTSPPFPRGRILVRRGGCQKKLRQTDSERACASNRVPGARTSRGTLARSSGNGATISPADFYLANCGAAHGSSWPR